MAIGKISGPMLKENLLREGIDLAFETDLLYLDVNNRRVGIKTSTPTHDLTVNGTARSTDLEVTSTADIGDVTISGNQIFSNTSVLNLSPGPGGHVVYQNKIVIDDLEIENNSISSTGPNTDIDIVTSGTGKVNVNADMEVLGNLHATGTITADGNITLGDANTDSIDFNADIASDIIPNVDNTYQLGTDTQRWKDVWVQNLQAQNISTGGFEISGIDITTRPGNTYYVSVNGADDNSGTHQQDPLSSIGRALDLATAGDTVYIYPGTYSETMPLVVPVGVAVKGTGIRSVTIQPDSDVTVDVFLLNGESTVEDLTITGFEYDVGTNTGYAFRFAPNMTVTSRSPYIRNVTVITAGSTVRLMTNPVDDPRGFLAGDAGKGAYVDGSIVNASSREASMLFHSVTFITPGVDAVTMTNGVRVEWLNCFTYFASKGLYAVSGSTGFAGDGKTRIKLTSRTGSWNVGNTLSYYDTDGTTVLASGTIDSIDGDFFNIDGKVIGFETLGDRVGKTASIGGDAKLSTAQKKFGTASLVLDGTGDFITYSSQPDFEFGSGDFTIELQYYPNNFSNFRVLYDQRTSAPDNAAYIDVTPSGTVRYIVASSVIVSTSTLNLTSWNHIAVSRVGGTTRLFINGVVQSTTLADSTIYAQRGIYLGRDYPGNAAYYVNGYFDEVRITKGLGRYTTTFTVPTSAFTSDTSTVLLLHFNGTNNSTIILDDGNTTQDIRNTTTSGTASAIDFADYSDFGAEIRSIASASVYGTYGAYGDGEGVIGYFIGSNFAYIGLGRFSDNDPNNVIQANEVVELNRAKLFYTTVDAQGDFRVGEYFLVDQQTGNVTFSQANITISSPSGIVFTDGVNTTEITPTKVETGNIRISGNTIESTSGGITLNAANNQIDTADNVNITGNLDVSGTFVVDSNVTLGTNSSNTLTINSKLSSNLVPNANALYDLGSTSFSWNNVYLSNFVSDTISISGNVIETTVSNADLELRANGTGNIAIPSDNLIVNGNVTVSGSTSLNDVSVSGTINVNTINTNNLTVNNTTTVINDIEISGNQIRTTVSNSDLELVANATGIISIPNNDLIVDQNLTVNVGVTSLKDTNVIGNLTASNVTTTTVTSASFITDTINISGNVIQTTVSNADLELRANGTGNVIIPTDSLTVGQNLTVQTGVTNLLDTNIVGTLTASSIVTTTISSSNFATDTIRIQGNVIETTVSNADLELRANGTGQVIIPNDNLTVSQNLNVTSGVTNLNTTNVSGTFTVTNLTTNSLTSASTLSTSDIEIAGNVIRTTQSNSNLELRANGTGFVVAENFQFSNSSISGTASEDMNLTPAGSGIVSINSNQSLKIPVGTEVQRPLTPQAGMVRFNSDSNYFEGYDGSYWTRLGGVFDVDNNTYILPESSPGANENTLYFYTNNTLSATLDSNQFTVNKLVVDNTEINGNVISTTGVNTDLELLPNGTGTVVFDNFKFGNNIVLNSTANAITEFRSTGQGYYRIVGNNAFVIPAGGNSGRPLVPESGMMRYNTDTDIVEIYTGTAWVSVAGASSGITIGIAEDLALTSALIFG